MQKTAQEMLDNGPDADDRRDGFERGSDGRLYWNDPTAKFESMLYDVVLQKFRKMSWDEHMIHNHLSP